MKAFRVYTIHSEYSASMKQNILYTLSLVLASNTGLLPHWFLVQHCSLNMRLSVCQLLAMKIRQRYTISSACSFKVNEYSKSVDKGIRKISKTILYSAARNGKRRWRSCVCKCPFWKDGSLVNCALLNARKHSRFEWSVSRTRGSFARLKRRSICFR